MILTGCRVIAVDYGGTLATGGRPGAPDRPVDPDAAATLHRLHAAGYGLVLSSNTPGRSRRPMLRVAGVEELFGGFVESHQVGVAKPDRAFYQEIVAVAGHPAEQILHVGNRLDKDVLAPVAIGMAAAYMCDAPDPVRYLPARAIHIRRFADLPSFLLRSVL